MDFSVLNRLSSSAGLKRLAEQCEVLAAGREMPLRADFRPSQFAWYIENLYLIDVLDGGTDYFMRITGCRIKDAYGYEIGGNRLGALGDSGFTRTLRNNFDTVRATRQPCYQRGTLCWPGGQCLGVERILVPMAGSAGDVVAILGGMAFDVTEDVVILCRGKGSAVYTPLPLEE